VIRDDVLRVAGDLLAERAGLRSTQAIEGRLEGFLEERSAHRNIPVDLYLTRLAAEPEELQELLDLVTVQETSFFRDGEHIEALVRRVVPGRRQPIIVWSAGCATGQEPYSIAMALDEAGVHDFRVVATDVSRYAVQRTREGYYRESELRGLSQARLGRYFGREGTSWRVAESLRQRVVVSKQNLLLDNPPVRLGEAVAVFCRNVLIYVRRDRIAASLARLRERLVADGVLFLGVSESLWRVPEGFELERIDDSFAYRRIDPSAPRAKAVRSASPGAPVRRTGSERPTATTPAACVRPKPRRPDPTPIPIRVPTDVERARQAAYLSPDDPLAHLQLGFSLEAAGDADAGRRAFRAARAALARSDETELETRLKGYGVDALRAVLAAKLEEDACR
jgi:chemotaxis protein methyltransferase CheR